MAGIVCAIRGGPDSKITIQAAIDLANQENQPIYFLYIVNLDFLVMTSSSRVHSVSEEMSEMGEFILLSAQTKAEIAGAEAFSVVRQGKVQKQIVELCEEINADFIVLGKPVKKQGTQENVFTQESLMRFKESLESQLTAKVIFADVEK